MIHDKHDELLEEDVITIILCIPQQPVRKVHAKYSTKISDLQCLFPHSPKKFIYNGSELLDKMTFDFYGIKNDDYIIALPQNEKSIYNFNQWINLSKEKDTFKESMNYMIQKNTYNESARIRDLRFMKIERNSKIFSKICKPFAKEFTDDNDDTFTKNVIMKQTILKESDAPSTNPLPILWARK